MTAVLVNAHALASTTVKLQVPALKPETEICCGFPETLFDQLNMNGGVPEEIQLKPFVIDYINFWMKERGAGHYKFINEIMFTLFSNSLTSISEGSKPQVIETQITMDYIVNYIVDVLVHFTKFKDDGTLNLREYLDNIFIQIVDIWGLISVYYPFLEMLSNNYEKSRFSFQFKFNSSLRYVFQLDFF